MFNEDVFRGSRSQFNEKLRILSGLAEEEKWSFAKTKSEDAYKILRNYIIRTYDRLEEENKLIETDDGMYMCANTGLLTVYHQEIIAIFKEYKGDYGYKWYLTGFFKSSDSRFTSIFEHIPPIADYTKEVRDLVYDRRLNINVQKEHIIDDNIGRFEAAGYNDKELINVLLDHAIKTIKLKLTRNYKLALPFYYHNSETGERKIQLLVPLYFAGAPVKLALVLSKEKVDEREYYEGITVLPVDWAYMNSRVIVKPEEEWARLVDEVEECLDLDEEMDENP